MMDLYIGCVRSQAKSNYDAGSRNQRPTFFRQFLQNLCIHFSAEGAENGERLEQIVEAAPTKNV